MSTHAQIVSGDAVEIVKPATRVCLLAQDFLADVKCNWLLVALEATPDQLFALALLAPIMHKFAHIDVVVSGLWDSTFAHDIDATTAVLRKHCKLPVRSCRVLAGWTRVRPGAPPLGDGSKQITCHRATRISERVCGTKLAYSAVVVLGDAADVARIAQRTAEFEVDAFAGSVLAFSNPPTFGRHTPTTAWWQSARRICMLPTKLLSDQGRNPHSTANIEHMVANHFPDLHAIACAYASSNIARDDAATMLVAALLTKTRKLRRYKLAATLHHYTWWLSCDTLEEQRALHTLLCAVAQENALAPPTRYI